MYISCNAPDYSQTTKPRGRVTVELPCLFSWGADCHLGLTRWEFRRLVPV